MNLFNTSIKYKLKITNICQLFSVNINQYCYCELLVMISMYLNWNKCTRKHYHHVEMKENASKDMTKKGEPT